MDLFFGVGPLDVWNEALIAERNGRWDLRYLFMGACLNAWDLFMF